MESMAILENREWYCCLLNEHKQPIQSPFGPATFGECISYMQGFNPGNANPVYPLPASMVPARLLAPIRSHVKAVA